MKFEIHPGTHCFIIRPQNQIDLLLMKIAMEGPTIPFKRTLYHRRGRERDLNNIAGSQAETRTGYLDQGWISSGGGVFSKPKWREQGCFIFWEKRRGVEFKMAGRDQPHYLDDIQQEFTTWITF